MPKAIHPEILKPRKKKVLSTYGRNQKIDEALPDKQAKIFNYVYGVEPDGNALQDPHNVFTGENILYREHDATDASRQFDINEDKVKELLEAAEETLFEIRNERPKPWMTKLYYPGTD